MDTDLGFWTELWGFSSAVFAQLYAMLTEWQTYLTGGGVFMVTFFANRTPRFHAWYQQVFTWKVQATIIIIAALCVASFQAYSGINAKYNKASKDFAKQIAEKDSQIADLKKNLDFIQSAAQPKSSRPSVVEVSNNAKLSIGTLNASGCSDGMNVRDTANVKIGKSNVDITCDEPNKEKTNK